MSETAQKTLADFKPPYSAEFHCDPIHEHILVLRANGQRLRIFSVEQRGEQGAIDAAWKAAYGPDTPSELDRLKEVNAELLEALKQLVADLRDYPVSERPCLAFDWAIAAIRKAEGR